MKNWWYIGWGQFKVIGPYYYNWDWDVDKFNLDPYTTRIRFKWIMDDFGNYRLVK